MWSDAEYDLLRRGLRGLPYIPYRIGFAEKLKLDLWKKYEHNRDAYTAAKGDFIIEMTKEARRRIMIRKATLEDLNQVEQGYTELLLHEQEHGAYTAWQLGVYPTRTTAEKAEKNGSLYVLEQDGEICASIIINHTQPEEYGGIDWKCAAKPEEILVIHLLCVRPSKAGHGFGRRMVQFAIEEGERWNCRAVRLDTGEQNKPAVALYTKMGFALAGTTSMAIGGLIAHKNHLFFERKLSNE